jgi:hypothetical protein
VRFILQPRRLFLVLLLCCFVECSAVSATGLDWSALLVCLCACVVPPCLLQAVARTFHSKGYKNKKVFTSKERSVRGTELGVALALAKRLQNCLLQALGQLNLNTTPSFTL